MSYEKQERSKGFEINTAVFFRMVLKKLWLVIIFAVIFALAGTGISTFMRKDVYTSRISFVVNTLKDSVQAENSDISASINIATTYSYILKSRTLLETAAEKCEIPVDYNEVLQSVNVQTMTSSSVIEMTVKTDNPDKSYAIAKSIVENYSTIVPEIYSNANLNLCDYPVKPTAPDTSALTLVVAIIGAVLGALAGVIVILIYYFANETIREVGEIERKLGLNILGTLNKIDLGKNKKSGLLVTNKNVGFAFIETFKAIRTKVESNAVKEGHKVFMVTSACENEGKTTVSANLAVTLAQNGKSVLLIDADLRKPAVNTVLNLENNSTKSGLVGVINGKATLESSIRYIDKYNIFVISDSRASDKPSELLSTKKMADIISAVRNEFDFVIIDTAPASVVTDASVISSLSDASILVIREDKAPVSRIKMSIDDINNNGAYVIGCVYNSSTGKQKHYGKSYNNYGYYGSYGYGYEYGYGYGYGGKSSK